MYTPFGKNGRPIPAYDSDKKVLCRSSKGWYYLRNKKPTGKDAVLNETFKKNKNCLKVCAPAAARIRQKLEPWMHDLKYGNTYTILLKGLMKSYKENGGKKIDYSHFLKADLFKDYTLEKLMAVRHTVNVKKNSVGVSIPINKNTVLRKNNVVSQYYFELILLWGDPIPSNALKGALRVDDVRSENYRYETPAAPKCALEIVLPTRKAPWMCILRVGSIEMKQPAAHMKNYAMHVVAVGS
jgi:hypothetical protein